MQVLVHDTQCWKHFSSIAWLYIRLETSSPSADEAIGYFFYIFCILCLKRGREREREREFEVSKLWPMTPTRSWCIGHHRKPWASFRSTPFEPANKKHQPDRKKILPARRSQKVCHRVRIVHPSFAAPHTWHHPPHTSHLAAPASQKDTSQPGSASDILFADT